MTSEPQALTPSVGHSPRQVWGAIPLSPAVQSGALGSACPGRGPRLQVLSGECQAPVLAQATEPAMSGFFEAFSQNASDPSYPAHAMASVTSTPTSLLSNGGVRGGPGSKIRAAQGLLKDEGVCIT